MQAILKAILGAIIGPLVREGRAWVEGREARKQIALTAGLQARASGQARQINILKKVAEIHAKDDPNIRTLLGDLVDGGGVRRADSPGGNGR